MYTIEFQTQITDQYLQLKDFERLANKHARVIIIVEEEADRQSALSAFDRMTKNRANKPKVGKETAIDNMEDDINSDLF